jgi:hypothetical protein
MTSRLAKLAGKTVSPYAFLPGSLQLRESRSKAGDGVSAEDGNCESSAGTQLACLLQQYQTVTDRAINLVSVRSNQELSRRVQPDSWSVAECLDHVALTTRTFSPSMSAAIAKAPKLTAPRALRTGHLAALLIRALEPPYRVRHKVIACLVPQTHDFVPAWNGFLDSQTQLANLIRSTIGLAIDQVSIESPACTHASYRLYGALGILAAHQRRHLWQIERILTALDRRAS